jgi:2-oxoglutarate ferredoxin oxidoreductase subunit gamma
MVGFRGKKSMHEEVIMSGFGGQGILLMGQLLCYAGMRERLNVTWMPAYGPEMRGGTANCTVILSSDRVGSPVTLFPSSMVIMNRASLDRFEASVKPGGILVINTSLVDREVQRNDLKVLRIPANRIAEEADAPQAANMVALGAYVAVTGIVHLDSVISALKWKIPESRKKLLLDNEEALKKGMERVLAQTDPENGK